MKPFRMACLLLLAAPWPALAARRPVLRPMTTLAAPVVRLGDLFAHLGRDGRRILGPGPAPGGRIEVGARQLAYIARRYDVDWRPASPAERAELTWPGRAFTRAEAMVPLTAALRGAGAGRDARIRLDGFTPPVVPVTPAVTPAISALTFDPGSGRFSALLVLSAPGIAPIQLPLAGRVEAMVDLPVAAHPLTAGAVLTAADMRMERRPAALVAGGAARRPGQVVGRELAQALAAGAPFPRTALRPPQLVRKGAAVVIRVRSPGLALTASGRALDAGGMGDQVRVLNPVSHAVLAALVTGPGTVRVTAGAPPLIPAGGVAR
ncbi:MAG: flagellar basal body P-ring formation chaperone FlgA [Acetobacteraceae bacterium]